MRVVVKHFSELTTDELLDLAILRVSVFVVEQKCAYQEIDEQDRTAWHLLLYDETASTRQQPNGMCVACSRFFVSTPGHFTADEGAVLKHGDDVSSETPVATFGRVAVDAAHRRSGLGKRLVRETITATRRHMPNKPIYIGAQAYLERFYRGLGFEVESDAYLLDEIPHMVMTLAVEAAATDRQ